jgi:hypothetical protein
MGWAAELQLHTNTSTASMLCCFIKHRSTMMHAYTIV